MMLFLEMNRYCREGNTAVNVQIILDESTEVFDLLVAWLFHYADFKCTPGKKNLNSDLTS